MVFNLSLHTDVHENDCNLCKLHQNPIDKETCELFRRLCSETPGHLAKECKVPCRACLEGNGGMNMGLTAKKCGIHCCMCGGLIYSDQDKHLTCRVQAAHSNRQPASKEKDQLLIAQNRQCQECHMRHLTQHCPAKRMHHEEGCPNRAVCTDHCQNCGWLAYNALPDLFNGNAGDRALFKPKFEKMHEAHCREWIRTECRDDLMLEYRLLCSKKDTHQARDPVELEDLCLRWLRKIISNGSFDAEADKQDAIQGLTPGQIDWSAYPECQGCWNVLYTVDKGTYAEIKPGQARSEATALFSRHSN